MEPTIVHWGYIIMEKKMETSIVVSIFCFPISVPLSLDNQGHHLVPWLRNHMEPMSHQYLHGDGANNKA